MMLDAFPEPEKERTTLELRTKAVYEKCIKDSEKPGSRRRIAYICVTHRAVCDMFNKIVTG